MIFLNPAFPVSWLQRAMIGRTPLLRLAHDIVGRASEQGVRFGFSCAGSGGAAIAALLQTPGASQCLTAAHAPYSRTEVSHLSASSVRGRADGERAAVKSPADLCPRRGSFRPPL